MEKHWGKLSDDWMDIDEIIIYCFGPAAEVVFDRISKDIRVRFVIDNNPVIYGTEYKGIPIYSYKECKDNIGKTKIVVTAEAISGVEISEALKADGYCENEDFVTLERFISEWYYRRFGQANLLEIHTSITTRCTFNCRYCNVFMPYCKEKIDYTLDEVKQNIDLLFCHIDFVFKYQLIGGEPLLNQDLSKILLYLQENYRDRIGMIRIVTNGGVIPHDELVEAMKKSDCYVLMSDYTHNIPYHERYNKVKNTLLKNGIKFRELIAQRWRDVGFPHSPRNLSDEDVRKHMLTCSTFWHGLVNERLYYCNCTWSAANTGMYSPEETDYLVLKELDNSEDSKIEILKFVLGDRYSEYYNSFCRVCGGCGKDNEHFVASGEQMNGWNKIQSR